MSQEQVSLSSFNPEVNARCRAYILQAIHERPGMTYMEIRGWIQLHKHFGMENVGGRVRELARELKVPLARIEYDSRHRVHVYPIEDLIKKEE